MRRDDVTKFASATRRSSCALASVVLATLFLAGCGGSSHALTRQQYVAKLNSYCRAFGKQEAKYPAPKTLAEVGRENKAIAALFARLVERPLAALEAPDEIQGDAQTMLALAHKQHRILVRISAAATRGDLDLAQSLAVTNHGVNQAAAVVAKRLGATACA
jgi:hypothetical protein